MIVTPRPLNPSAARASSSASPSTARKASRARRAFARAQPRVTEREQQLGAPPGLVRRVLERGQGALAQAARRSS